MAGLDERTYSYTIITTTSNSQLKFLHSRMPVILEPFSADINRWLDPFQDEWSQELQAILKPFDGELDAYRVRKEVGKVGNSSSTFIVPLDSKENVSNIMNYFSREVKGDINKKRKRE